MYPAVAVLQAIEDDPESAQALEDLMWIGGSTGMDKIILEREGLSYRTIPAAGLHGVGLRKLPGNILQLVRGYLHSRKIIREFQPDVLFFTGGYLAVPVAAAGRRIPSVLFVPDIEPGLALKTIARLADRIAVTADESTRYFRTKTKLEVTGYPVRRELDRWNKKDALADFRLSDTRPVTLVFGGSTGARSINRALVPVLPELLEFTQIIHITGTLDWPELEDQPSKLPGDLAKHYRIFPYLHQRMGAALTAADLVVSRAGASVLGEFPHFGLPAVLVPYPHAWQYQQINAEYLQARGAAEILQDQNLQDDLLPRIKAILQDPDRLTEMKHSMESTARPGAAQRIAQLLFDATTAVRRERLS